MPARAIPCFAEPVTGKWLFVGVMALVGTALGSFLALREVASEAPSRSLDSEGIPPSLSGDSPRVSDREKPETVATLAGSPTREIEEVEAAVLAELAKRKVTMEKVDPEDYGRVAALKKLIHDLFQRSPAEARSWVVSLPKRGVFLTAYQELGRLESSDPESALAQMDRMEDGPGLESFYSGLLSGMAVEDPAYAMKVFALNEETFPAIGSLDSIVVQSTLAGNPRLTLFAIRKQLPRDEHPRFFYQTYSHWAAMNVHEALSDLESRNMSQALSLGAVALFERWARMDRPAFEAWMAANGDSRFLPQATRARNKVQLTEPKPEGARENRIEMPVFETKPN